MNEVADIGGSSAHKKLHGQSDDIRKTTEIAYSSQFFSINEVIKETAKYLK